MENTKREGIPLENGTGEVEMLHFTVQKQHYAINVVKVREIINISHLTVMPNVHPAVSGLALIRGEVMSVVDLTMVLNKEVCQQVEGSLTLVCEFNKMMVAFLIDEVVGIYRVRWNQILKPDFVSSNSLVIGNITWNNTILMMLDFEKIMMEISPESGIRVEQLKSEQLSIDRSKYRLLLADDSPLIRAVVTQSLQKAGINQLKTFDDGQDAWNYILSQYEAKGNQFLNEVDLLITDIEMPELDGHTLTRYIKEHPILKQLPVIIFSSLITDDLQHIGESVGADAQMSKPEVSQLVDLVDQFLQGRYESKGRMGNEL